MNRRVEFDILLACLHKKCSDMEKIMTKIDIVSGFLGAGKTTLIKKLLKEALTGQKVVLIENEFGEIGVDGGFLKEAGIEIKEMNSGCICCSLVGDFGTSLKEVMATYHPDRILIEPSGVGKLSDVMRAVMNVDMGNDVVLNSAVAVVDASKCKMYIKNFGEFFINQIEHAGTIILSRTGDVKEEKLEQAISLIRKHNQKATIITTAWDNLNGIDILNTIEGATDLEKEMMQQIKEHHEEHDDEDEHEHHHHHEKHEHAHHEEHDDEDEHEHHHEHGEGCTCGCHDHNHEGHHHADEVFTSWGEETPHQFTEDEIQKILNEFENEKEYGFILRSKGMVADKNSDQWIYFDYVPGECNIRAGKPDVTGKICVIGSKLQEDHLKRLFFEA